MSNSFVRRARALKKDTPALDRHAEEIRSICARTVRNIVAIGRQLIAAKKLAGHGFWGAWLEMEFGWSDRTARNFMNVAELAKSETVSDLEPLDMSSVYLLARPSTSDAARRAVMVEVAKNSGELPAERVREIIREANANETSVKKGKLMLLETKVEPLNITCPVCPPEVPEKSASGDKRLLTSATDLLQRIEAFGKTNGADEYEAIQADEYEAIQKAFEECRDRYAVLRVVDAIREQGD